MIMEIISLLIKDYAKHKKNILNKLINIYFRL